MGVGKVLTAKLEDMSSIPAMYMVEGEIRLSQRSSDLQTRSQACKICSPFPMHTLIN